MKYIFLGLAAVAAAVALFVRPPGTAPVVALDQRAATSAARDASGRPPSTSPLSAPSRAPLRDVIVYVAGEVRKPGVYAFAADRRGVDAVARAGGPLADADLVAVNLAAPLSDGDEIAVPKIGDSSRVSHTTRSRLGHHRPARHKRSAHFRHTSKPNAANRFAEPARIDLNAADEPTLENVPGIGPSLAARIVAYRNLNGPFASVDELADVSGVTPHLQDTLAQFAFVR